jgi:hypothetical protein
VHQRDGRSGYPNDIAVLKLPTVRHEPQGRRITKMDALYSAEDIAVSQDGARRKQVKPPPGSRGVCARESATNVSAYKPPDQRPSLCTGF